jgi:uncharacterized damage-inducible protein DinB
MTGNDTMKRHIQDLFAFNDWANRNILNAFLGLEGIEEPLRLFSHMINSQNKWLNRIGRETPDTSLSWTAPLYDRSTAGKNWDASVRAWIGFLQGCDDVGREIHFQASDGGSFKATIASITLQLNFHSIHHRAQIMAWLRSRGIAPPQSDYILLKRQPTGA